MYFILVGGAMVMAGGIGVALKGLHEINDKLRELDFEEQSDYLGEEEERREK
ncbi:MAG: hypothetical protein WD037_11350 [Balneolales bacterium]